jgi:hypothetical protein
MRLSVGLRGDPCVTSYVVRSLHMYIDRRVERAVYTDAARQCGIFGMCATAITFTCAAIF